MALDLLPHFIDTLAYPSYPILRRIISLYLLYHIWPFLSVTFKLASGFLSEFPLQTVNAILTYLLLTLSNVSHRTRVMLTALRFLIFVWMRHKNEKMIKDDTLKKIDSSLSYSNPLKASLPFPISDKAEAICVLVVIVAVYKYVQGGSRCKSVAESLWKKCG